MAYHVYLWDPGKDTEFPGVVDEFERVGPVLRPWSCGNAVSVAVGDVAVLRRTRSSPTGVVGLGRVVRGSYSGHWEDGKEGTFVDVEWEFISTEPILAKEEYPEGDTLWTAQAGGTSIDVGIGTDLVQTIRDRIGDIMEWAFLPDADAFVANWRLNPPTDPRRRMLLVHYWSPEEAMHPSYMARQMGWPTADTSHLHYGSFAGVTARQMDIDMPRSDNVALFSSIARVDGTLRWIMHEEVREAIRELGWHREGGPILSDEETEQARFAEGRLSQRQVTIRSRHASVRAFCLEHYGSVCAICRFDPCKAFGDSFGGLIEVHHLDPLAASDPDRETDPITDCRPLCPVCHGLAHLGMRAGTCRSLDDIRKLRGLP